MYSYEPTFISCMLVLWKIITKECKKLYSMKEIYYKQHLQGIYSCQKCMNKVQKIIERNRKSNKNFTEFQAVID